MKYRNLRELIPVAALAALVSAGYFNEHVIAENSEQYDETNLVPKYINCDFVSR